MKPIESIFIALSLLYYEYCNETQNSIKDIKGYLNRINIKIMFSLIDIHLVKTYLQISYQYMQLIISLSIIIIV